MIEHWLSLIEQYLAHKTVVAALVAGFVTSWVVTQGWKDKPFFIRKSDAAARWWTRGLAFASAFGPVACLWPLPGAPRWVFATAVGLASPVAYTLVVRIAGHFFPWLEGRVSARPAPPAPASNDFHQRES